MMCQPSENPICERGAMMLPTARMDVCVATVVIIHSVSVNGGTGVDRTRTTSKPTGPHYFSVCRRFTPKPSTGRR